MQSHRLTKLLLEHKYPQNTQLKALNVIDLVLVVPKKNQNIEQSNTSIICDTFVLLSHVFTKIVMKTPHRTIWVLCHHQQPHLSRDPISQE